MVRVEDASRDLVRVEDSDRLGSELRDREGDGVGTVRDGDASERDFDVLAVVLLGDALGLEVSCVCEGLFLLTESVGELVSSLVLLVVCDTLRCWDDVGDLDDEFDLDSVSSSVDDCDGLCMLRVALFVVLTSGELEPVSVREYDSDDDLEIVGEGVFPERDMLIDKVTSLDSVMLLLIETSFEALRDGVNETVLDADWASLLKEYDVEVDGDFENDSLLVSDEETVGVGVIDTDGSLVTESETEVDADGLLVMDHAQLNDLDGESDQDRIVRVDSRENDFGDTVGDTDKLREPLRSRVSEGESDFLDRVLAAVIVPLSVIEFDGDRELD